MNPATTRLLGLGAVLALFVLMVVSFTGPREAFSYAPEGFGDEPLREESAASTDWDTFIPTVFRGATTPPAAPQPAAGQASAAARSATIAAPAASVARSSAPSKGTTVSVSYSAYASAGTTVSVGTTTSEGAATPPPPPSAVVMPPAPTDNSEESWDAWREEFEKRAEEWRKGNGKKGRDN